MRAGEVREHLADTFHRERGIEQDRRNSDRGCASAGSIGSRTSGSLSRPSSASSVLRSQRCSQSHALQVTGATAHAVASKSSITSSAAAIGIVQAHRHRASRRMRAGAVAAAQVRRCRPCHRSLLVVMFWPARVVPGHVVGASARARSPASFQSNRSSALLSSFFVVAGLLDRPLLARFGPTKARRFHRASPRAMAARCAGRRVSSPPASSWRRSAAGSA